MRMTATEVEALPWQEVESSNVARVAWVQSGEVGPFVKGKPPHLGHLYVEFHGSVGRIYRYTAVRKEQHGELVEAESVGGYLNAEIKPAHNCTRIEVALS
jgi:hypothetical protein